MIKNLEPLTLRAALENLEMQKARIERQIRTLRGSISRIQTRKPGRHSLVVVSLLNQYKAAGEGSPMPNKNRKRPPMSAEVRARISETQRFRWAALRQSNAAQNQSAQQ